MYIQIWVKLYGYNLRARLTVNSFNMPRDSASFKIPSSSTVPISYFKCGPGPGFYWWQFNPVPLDIDDILYLSLFAGFGFCASFLVMLQRPFVYSWKAGILTPHVRFLNASVGFGGSCFQKAAGFFKGWMLPACCVLVVFKELAPPQNDGCN